MMDIKPEIEAKPFKAYEVTRNSDGTRDICTLTRSTWNTLTGRFFAYKGNVYVEGEVSKCSQCGKWEIFTISDRCQECAHFDFYIELG